MWISKVDDVMTNEKKDGTQFNSNPLTLNQDFNHLRTPVNSMKPMVQRTTINLSDLSNDNAVVVSLSQKRMTATASFAAAAMSGVDESLFMADWFQLKNFSPKIFFGSFFISKFFFLINIHIFFTFILDLIYTMIYNVERNWGYEKICQEENIYGKSATRKQLR